MIALARALRARGHLVALQSWQRWRAEVEAERVQFAPAPEYPVFPSGHPHEPLDFHSAIPRATRDTLPLLDSFKPHVVVADILTLAPALAAEIRGVPCATLIPHVYPHTEPPLPVYSIGARLPRTPLGSFVWSAAHRPVARGLALGREQLNQVRSALSLTPTDRLHGGISTGLALLATFPQLEYPRAWPDSVRLVGPLMWEPPYREVQPPPGAAPLVLVAPSTAQDPEHRMLAAALRGLAHAPVRILATYNRRLPPRPLFVPPNARVVEWLSYSRTMPRCDAVICHAGHGTLARALACGVPVVACPALGDMNENAARLAWSGAGVRVPRRFVTPRALRLATEHVLSQPSIAARARELAAWARSHDAGTAAAELVEALAA